MPVIRGQMTEASITEEQRKVLLKKLEHELSGKPSPSDKIVWEIPLIFEIPLERAYGSLDRFDVLVVWDAFEELRSEERSALILDAYHDQADKIVQAFGVTRVEAMEQHLVPYQIRLLKKPRDVDPDLIKKAMIEEGGFQIGSRIVLYLPTRKMAEDALARLHERIPKAAWQIGEMIPQ